jgi:hypothetical protein
MPASIMQKNYSHCPLKKRPVFIVKEGNYHNQRNISLFYNSRKTAIAQKKLKAQKLINFFIVIPSQNQTQKWSLKT